MSHIVLVNIENDTEKVRRQFSPPFGLLIAASVLVRNNDISKSFISNRSIKNIT